jgi:nicotinamidase-related amidase
MRHPLSLLTREVAPIALDRVHTALVLQDLHAPFTDASDGALAREARRRGVEREFDEYWSAVPDVLTNATRLLEAARDLGLRVHHVRMAHASGAEPSAFQRSMGWTWDVGGDDALVDERLAPRGDEGQHTKPGWGAWASPELRSALQRDGVRSVVLCGLPFDFGIRHSCFEFADAGLRTLVASDATAALTAAAEAPTRGNLAHGATKLRSAAEVLDLLERVPKEGTVWV